MEALGLQKPVILESDRAKLLFQTYESRSDGSVRISPCVIVFDYDGPATDQAQRDRQAVILEAPGGARLQFDPPLDINRAKIGRLVQGQLDGPVTIRSDWKQPGPEDDLLIQTKDVQLTERTVFTPHPVEFRWGPNFGRGQGMVMKLLPGKPRPGMEATGTNIAGIESFELQTIQRLHIDLGQQVDGSGTAGLPADGTSATSRIASNSTSTTSRLAAVGTTAIGPEKATSIPVEIHCRGPFRFDVLHRVATFSDRVDVLKLNPGGPADQIACDVLSMYFSQRKTANVLPAPGSPSPPAPLPKGEGSQADKPQPGSLDLVAERLECRGRPVVLTVPSRKLTASAPRIEYNLLTEALTADGPGRLSGRLDQSSAGQLEAAWQKSFQYYPYQKQKVLSLDGNAELNYQGLGGLRASEIFFWLAPAPSSAGETQPPMRPDRMLARGGVRLNSSRLTGKLDQMEVWFQERGQRSEVRDQRSEKRPATAVAGASGADAAIQPSDVNAAARQYEVVGRLLQANVLLGGPQPGMSHLLVQDGVCFREIPSRPGDKPLLVRGDRLELADADRRTGCQPVLQNGSQPVPLSTVTVTGSPAHFEGQGLGLTGSNINLDRVANRLWIDGPGRMDVPLADKLPNLPIQTPVGGALTIDWHGRMDFDGGTARFKEAVVASGPAQKLRTEELEVKLHRPISFSATNPPEQPEVEEIRSPREVALENRSFDEQHQLASYDRMEVTDLAINAQSGALTAGGPGLLNSVSRGGGGLPAKPSASTAPTVSIPTTGKPSSNNQLHCLTVRFQGPITGNLFRRQLTFHDQVRVARAPVDDWNAILTTENPDALGPQGITLRCDQLSVNDMPLPTGNGRAIEFEALGNTIVDGTTFTARGHRITYTQAKDLLILEGDGRNDAQLLRQQKPGLPQSRLAAGKFLYWIKTQQWDISGASIVGNRRLFQHAGETVKMEPLGPDAHPGKNDGICGRWGGSCTASKANPARVPALNLLFFAVFLFLMLSGRASMFRDPGTFWHVADGEKMLAEGKVVRQDSFSFTRAGRPWVDDQWLAECGMAYVYQKAGWDGLLLLTAAMLAGFYTWVAARLLRAGLHILPVGLLLALAIQIGSPQFLIRPLALTIVLLGIVFAWLVDVESGAKRLRYLWWLVPLFIVWANVHGGVLGGLGTVGLCAIGWCVAQPPSAVQSVQHSRGRLCHTEPILLLSALTAATLVNPYGIDLPRAWLETLRMPLSGLIEEHAPLDLSIPMNWAVVALAAGYAAVLIGVSSRRPRVVWLIPLAWFVLTLARCRNASLFAVVAVIALADMLPYTRVGEWLRRREMLGAARSAAGWRAAVLPSIVVAAALGLQIAGASFPVLGRGWARFDRDRCPVELLPQLDEIARSNEDGLRIFNDMNFGGFLIFHEPRMRVFIDDRCPLYGTEFLRAYDHARRDDPARARPLATAIRISIRDSGIGRRFRPLFGVFRRLDQTQPYISGNVVFASAGRIAPGALKLDTQRSSKNNLWCRRPACSVQPRRPHHNTRSCFWSTTQMIHHDLL